MIRSMTFVVATLSGCVANGHQTMHCVSSTPSKTPYGGYSPVRLQTSCQKRPLPRATELMRFHSSYLFRTLMNV